MLNETEAGAYQRALQDWEAERNRQQVEFTVTEQDPDADARIPEFDVRINTEVIIIKTERFE